MTEKNYQEIIKSMRIGECRYIKPNFYFKIDNDYGIKTKQLHNKEYEFEIVYLNEKTESDMIKTLQKNVIINNLKPEEIMANKSLCDALLKDDNFKTKLINNQEFVKQILIDQDKIQDIFNNCDSKEKEKIIEIVKSQKILNYEDVSKYTNALEDFEDIYIKNPSAKEDDWQNFFQKHLWVLGLSLQQQLLIPSRDGRDIKNELSKRNILDGSLISEGKVKYLTICEFKKCKDKEDLLVEPYRKRKGEVVANCFAPTSELSGGIAQILQYKRNIQKEAKEQKITDKAGNDTGKVFQIVDPKCYLIIGDLKELEKNDGKKQCFELFRRNCKDVEIITYDEIYEKINYIVKNMTNNKAEHNEAQEESNEIDNIDDDIPF